MSNLIHIPLDAWEPSYMMDADIDEREERWCMRAVDEQGQTWEATGIYVCGDLTDIEDPEIVDE